MLCTSTTGKTRAYARIAIENPSHYLALEGHEWSEVDFLNELAVRTGCGLLLDVNNVFVSVHNLGGDAMAYLDAFPVAHLMEVHLAGHRPDAHMPLLIDSHDAPVSPEVWRLYRHLVARTGSVPTLIERDDQVPAFDALLVDDPLHQVGMTRRTGRDAFHEIARIGRLLYPDGIRERVHHVLVSDGRTVATLLTMRARTNKGVDYENLYGMFLDIVDGRVVAFIEVLDSRVADAAFDLSALR